jgi:cytochrome c oxidase assembly factor CtaG
VLLALALVSPIHALGGALLSAHMVQHEILMVVATPLLVLGRPLVPALWAIPAGWRRALGRAARRAPVRAAWLALTRPLIAAVVHGSTIWLWHTPSLYQAGLRSAAIHTTQHIAFIVTALLFWWAVLHARRARSGEAVLALFVTVLHTGALGALLAFSGSLWYPAYAATTGPWGLSPLEDQQLAGLIMWIPGGLAYLVAALTIVGGWLSAPRQRAPRLSRAVAGMLIGMIALGGCRGGLDDDHSMRVLGGDPERGRIAIGQYGCPSCHVIPGVVGAKGTIGPPLTGIASRAYIGGVITNTPENMIRWIVDPPRIDSLTAMPALGISDSLARDIAEYLYTIR